MFVYYHHLIQKVDRLIYIYNSFDNEMKKHYNKTFWNTMNSYYQEQFSNMNLRNVIDLEDYIAIINKKKTMN